MTDGLSQCYRDRVKHVRIIQDCEAACVVANAIWSTPFKRPTAMETFFRWGGEVSPDERENIMSRRWVYSMDYPPIDWARACELLGCPALAEHNAEISDQSLTELAVAGLRHLDIRLENGQEEMEFIGRLNRNDRAAWAILIHASDIGEFKSRWCDRLQASSPFADQELMIFQDGDLGRAVDYALRVAQIRGWRAEVVWFRSRGRQESLRVAAVPKLG